MKTLNTLSNSELIDRYPSIGTTKPIGKASARYSFVPTIKTIDYLRESGWLPIMAGESQVRKIEKNGFQRHMIRFTRPDLVVNGHRMDLLLYNSHDTGSAFKLIGGVFRFVCSNGMVMGDKLAEFSHKHVGFSADAFIESAVKINGQLEKTAGVIDDWQAIELTRDEQGVFAQAAHQLIYDTPEEAPIQADQLLKTRRFEDRGKEDLWTGFNVIQENAIKGGLRGRNLKTGRRTTTRPVKSIDKDRKLNQALWFLSTEMARLKTA